MTAGPFSESWEVDPPTTPIPTDSQLTRLFHEEAPCPSCGEPIRYDGPIADGYWLCSNDDCPGRQPGGWIVHRLYPADASRLRRLIPWRLHRYGEQREEIDLSYPAYVKRTEYEA